MIVLVGLLVVVLVAWVIAWAISPERAARRQNAQIMAARLEAEQRIDFATRQTLSAMREATRAQLRQQGPV